jgi:zinc protease
MRREDVTQHHARLYRPDNATLIFAGDIAVDDAVALAQAAFGRWARPASPLELTKISPPAPVAGTPLVIAMTGAGQAGVALAAPSVARSAPDYFAGVVANALLGGGYSSRLNQEIRIKRGLSYGVASQLDALRDGGVFSVAVQTKNSSAPEVIALMLEQIALVADAPAPADELDARKQAIIGAVSRRFETTESLAGSIASLEANGIDVAELTRTIPQLAAVTPAEVQAFARRHWRADGAHVVVAGEAPQFVDALRASFPELVVVEQADIDLDRPGVVKAGGQ